MDRALVDLLTALDTPQTTGTGSATALLTKGAAPQPDETVGGPNNNPTASDELMLNFQCLSFLDTKRDGTSSEGQQQLPQLPHLTLAPQHTLLSHHQQERHSSATGAGSGASIGVAATSTINNTVASVALPDLATLQQQLIMSMSQEEGGGEGGLGEVGGGGPISARERSSGANANSTAATAVPFHRVQKPLTPPPTHLAPIVAPTSPSSTAGGGGSHLMTFTSTNSNTTTGMTMVNHGSPSPYSTITMGGFGGGINNNTVSCHTASSNMSSMIQPHQQLHSQSTNTLVGFSGAGPLGAINGSALAGGSHHPGNTNNNNTFAAHDPLAMRSRGGSTHAGNNNNNGATAGGTTSNAGTHSASHSALGTPMNGAMAAAMATAMMGGGNGNGSPALVLTPQQQHAGNNTSVSSPSNTITPHQMATMMQQGPPYHHPHMAIPLHPQQQQELAQIQMMEQQLQQRKEALTGCGAVGSGTVMINGGVVGGGQLLQGGVMPVMMMQQQQPQQQMHPSGMTMMMMMNGGQHSSPPMGNGGGNNNFMFNQQQQQQQQQPMTMMNTTNNANSHVNMLMGGQYPNNNHNYNTGGSMMMMPTNNSGVQMMSMMQQQHQQGMLMGNNNGHPVRGMGMMMASPNAVMVPSPVSPVVMMPPNNNNHPASPFVMNGTGQPQMMGHMNTNSSATASPATASTHSPSLPPPPPPAQRPPNRRKTTYCNFYPDNVHLCPFGDQCAYAHTKAERKNARDRLKEEVGPSGGLNVQVGGGALAGSGIGGVPSPTVVAKSGGVSFGSGNGTPQPQANNSSSFPMMGSMVNAGGGYTSNGGGMMMPPQSMMLGQHPSQQHLGGGPPMMMAQQPAFNNQQYTF